MRKSAIVFAMLAIIAAPQAALFASDNADAATYLSTHNSSPWSVMGLVVGGKDPGTLDFLKSVSETSAIQYAAPILALTAAGKDPKTFGSDNYVAKLKSFHASGQLGDPTSLNDDAFGILALVSAGVTAIDSVVSDSKAFLLSHQNANGGWGFVAGSESDTNTTASVILALRVAGVPATDGHITSAADYLHSAQNEDGGFPYDPKSSFGAASDSSSTSWVIWAMNVQGISDASWTRNGKTARQFLESTQTANGFFEYQAGSGEDSFSPITTGYAMIALSGKFLPLKILSAPAEQFDFRIEGSNEQVCEGRTAGPTALDVVKHASTQCGFTYHITDTSFGPYLDQINTDTASGLIGWLYLVNDVSPSVGAAEYQLKTGDRVLWYYGDYQWLPTRLSATPSETDSGGHFTATVEYFKNNSWLPLSRAIVLYGTHSSTADTDGHALISPKDGYYKIFAEKPGYIRSNTTLVKIGDPTGGSIDLSVNVDTGTVLGETTPPSDTIVFTVGPTEINFGTMNPGQSLEKSVTLSNTGTSSIHVESVVTGDSLFTDFLTIDAGTWRKFKTELATNEQEQHSLKLSLPASYSVSGSKSGRLTFWAVAQ